jgi:hypothetical protein
MYFRVKMQDRDGKFSYSNLALVAEACSTRDQLFI